MISLKPMKIAFTNKALALEPSFEKNRMIRLDEANLMDVSAVIMTSQDGIPSQYDTIHAFGIPVFP